MTFSKRFCLNGCNSYLKSMCLYLRQNEYDYTFDNTPSPADYASTPNPSSSNYQADTPSPMGPYTPQTPGSGYSPYHASPSPSGYQGIVLTPHYSQCDHISVVKITRILLVTANLSIYYAVQSVMLINS